MYRHICRRYILHTEHNIPFLNWLLPGESVHCVTVQQTDGVSTDNLSSLTEFLQREHFKNMEDKKTQTHQETKQLRATGRSLSLAFFFSLHIHLSHYDNSPSSYNH